MLRTWAHPIIRCQIFWTRLTLGIYSFIFIIKFFQVCNDENSTCSSSNFDSENSAKTNPSENSANSEFVKCSDPKSSYFSVSQLEIFNLILVNFQWNANIRESSASVESLQKHVDEARV